MFALCMCGAATAQDKKIPKRRRPRYPAAPTVAKRKPVAASLPARSWDPVVRETLERFIIAHGSAAPAYTVTSPPTAAIIWEDVAFLRHPGEAVFRRMVDRAEFKFSDAFWELIPEHYRPRARTGYGGFHDLPVVVWPKDPYYGMFRKAMFSAYEDLCRAEGARVCRAWLVRLLSGFSDTNISLYMKQAVEEEEKLPLALESISESSADENPSHARVGMRDIPEMKDLVKALLDNGFDVWILSSSNQWVAEVSAARYGINPSRVVGIRCRVRNRILFDTILDPIPIGTGEAEALARSLGSAPDLVVGAKEDKELLEYGGGDGMRLVMDRGDIAFRSYARGQGWLIQPAFASATE